MKKIANLILIFAIIVIITITLFTFDSLIPKTYSLVALGLFYLTLLISLLFRKKLFLKLVFPLLLVQTTFISLYFNKNIAIYQLISILAIVSFDILFENLTNTKSIVTRAVLSIRLGIYYLSLYHASFFFLLIPVIYIKFNYHKVLSILAKYFPKINELNSNKKLTKNKSKTLSSDIKVLNKDRKILNSDREILNSERKTLNSDRKILNNDRRILNIDRIIFNSGEKILNTEIMVYLSIPNKSTLYHYTMWHDEFMKLGKNIIIVLREDHCYQELTNIHKDNSFCEVFLMKKSVALDDFVSKLNIKLVFYMNNGMKNTHMVKYHNIIHIQLLHGDSEKSASYSPVSKMYNFLFVSGQAAKQRYWDNQVMIPDSSFKIIGRPQLANLKTESNTTIKTVLYAPTWQGYKVSENLSSLEEYGYAIVKYLTDNGYNVIFRPHPYTYQNTDHQKICLQIKKLLKDDNHTFLGPTQKKLSVTECYDLSDAMISDFSSVLSDYLYTEKPLINIYTYEGIPKETPILNACYIIEEEDDLPIVFDDIITEDSKKEIRKKTKEAYHGNIEPSDRDKIFKQTVENILG